MTGSPPEFRFFLPQMRLDFAALGERALAAESAGFGGIALIDHLAPPGAEDKPMFDAMVTATWLAARTATLGVGHLVLCEAMRHPAVLAKQAVSLDHASGGRFELGIGWGSVPAELDQYGVASAEPAARVRRLAETLEVLAALWTGEEVTFDGEFHRIAAGCQRPAPLDRIPIVIGGAGPKTLELVARHADWWNLPLHRIDDLDELRASAGRARVSVQVMVALVPDEGDRSEVTETARRRFGAYGNGLVIGTAPELVDRFGTWAQRGVERFYVWFADFAPPETLAAFGRDVIAAVDAR